MPGQYGGFLGREHNPFLIEGDPSSPGYNPLSLTLPEGLNAERLQARLNLANQLDTSARLLEKELDRQYDRLRQSAYELVIDSRVRRALDLNQESDKTRQSRRSVVFARKSHRHAHGKDQAEIREDGISGRGQNRNAEQIRLAEPQ